jgi:hypothetical protein
MERASGVQLDSKALRDAINGNTLHMIGGGSVSAAVAPDLKIHMMVDGAVVITGTWHVENGMLVADIPGTDVSGSYFAFLEGSTLSLYEPNGLLSVQFEIEQGLPEGF